jgi:hypothetical protein
LLLLSRIPIPRLLGWDVGSLLALYWGSSERRISEGADASEEKLEVVVSKAPFLGDGCRVFLGFVSMNGEKLAYEE